MVKHGFHPAHIKCAGLELVFTDSTAHLHERSYGHRLHHRLTDDEMRFIGNDGKGRKNVDYRLVICYNNASSRFAAKLVSKDFYVKNKLT